MKAAAFAGRLFLDSLPRTIRNLYRIVFLSAHTVKLRE